MANTELTPKMRIESSARIDYLKQVFADAPKEYQPVIPEGTPRAVPYTEHQMITWDNLQKGELPVEPQMDNEFFIRLGCRWSCTSCSVPEHIRHAPEVLMTPQFWGRVFEITERRVVERMNPDLAHGEEPKHAPYIRIIGGEPSTYRANDGDIVDIMRLSRERPYLMSGLFSDGASLHQLPEIMEQLTDVLERFHTSVDYFPREELPKLNSTESSDRDTRATYGAHVAHYYTERGIDAVANIVLIPPDSNSSEPGNLDHVLEISQWLWDRNISTTYAPIIWRAHQAQHGRKKHAYSTHLGVEHADVIKEIVENLVGAQLYGQGRVRNSRAYLEGMPFAGIDQLIGWNTIPGTISISPNGRMGYDPMFKTLYETLHSPGGYYGYEDHQGKWDDFRGQDYIPMLMHERQKWQWIAASTTEPATRVNPQTMVETIEQAILFWEENTDLLEPSNGGNGNWWDNTIKNTKYARANPTII